MDGSFRSRSTLVVLGLVVAFSATAQTEPALIAAVKHDQGVQRIVQLIRDGADVNVRDKDRKTALMFAAALEDVQVVQVLVSHGADVNAVDVLGRTALIRAAMTSEVRTVELLLRNGARVNWQDRGGRSALMWAAERPQIVYLLLKAGADCKLRDHKGLTAYQVAEKLAVARSASMLRACEAAK
jgi:uncharacterized protein